MKIKNILLISLLFLLSCSSEEKVFEAPVDPNIVKAIGSADNFESLMADGRVLRRASISDKEGIRAAMQRAKGALVALGNNKNDRNALRVLERTLLDLRAFNVSVRDRERVNEVFNQMDFILVQYARAMGVKVSELGTLLYQFDLANGESESSVAPFGIFSYEGKTWKRGESLDEYTMRAGGSGHVWLISPRFDLTNVVQPGLRLDHLFNVNANNKADTFDLQKIRSEAFQILISEDYVKGDPSSARWEKLDFGILPSGREFHRVDSGVVNFNKYEGKKVTVAFAYNAKAPSVGESFKAHRLTWWIYRFEVYGTGPSFSFKPFVEEVKIEPDFSVNFNDLGEDALANFTQETISGEPGEYYYRDDERIGKTFIRANSGIGIRRLYSPVYSFENTVKPAVSLNHAARGYNDDLKKNNYLKLFAALDDGNNNPSGLTWVNLKMPAAGIPDSFDSVDSPRLPLPEEFIGQRVRFAFERESVQVGKFSNPVWDIHQINIIDLTKVPSDD